MITLNTKNLVSLNKTCFFTRKNQSNDLFNLLCTCLHVRHSNSSIKTIKDSINLSIIGNEII